MSKQHAILVGLKSVDEDAYGGWNGENGCWGCELDVDNIERILSPLGYKSTIIKTARATRSAVLDALKAAAKKLKSGDTLLFYYSGHGGQQPDRNGDEADGRDETLVAYDGEVIDDQLNEIWVKFKSGVRIIMISDSCNSGTNYRNLRNVREATPIHPLAPDVSTQMRAEMIHLGGCRDGYTSSGYQAGGKFTMALCEVWNDGAFQGDYRDFYEAIRNQVTGQVIQYNEYGPVTAAFSGQKPFSPSAVVASSDGGPQGHLPDDDDVSLSRTATAGGMLSGPRMGGTRGVAAARAAGGVIAKQSGVNAIVRSQLAGKIHPSATIRYGDGTYYLPTISEIRNLLAASQSDRRTWTAERFDCDDFSYVLKGEAAAHSYNSADFRFGLCVGIIWGNFDWVNGYHAVNWFIDSQRSLYLIEPQTDLIYRASQCSGDVSLIVV